jgi:hypothetical protein
MSTGDLGEVDHGPALLVPRTAMLRSLRRSVIRELANCESADPGDRRGIAARRTVFPN